MKSLLYGLVLIIWLATFGYGDEADSTWDRCEVLRTDQVVVHLLCRREASLSDEDWLKLQFTRIGDREVGFKDGSYRMESERFSPDGRNKICSGDLASGNVYDLFGNSADWNTRGEFVLTEHPSRYSSTLLGLAPPGGLWIQARLHLNFETSDGIRKSTPDQGVPFSFQWNPPDEAGITRMRKRLLSLLHHPESESNRCHAYILMALLKILMVSEELPLHEILAAIDRRRGGFDGREALVAHSERYKKDVNAIRDHYLRLLERKDVCAADDLLQARWLWDRRFVAPLVAMHENPGHTPPFMDLTLLSAHDSDWEGDPTIPSRLSAPLLENYGMFLRKTPQDLIRTGQLRTWASYSRDLGMTRDRGALPWLIPFLDCKEPIEDRQSLVSAIEDVPSPPNRACDAALHAILMILDGNAAQGTLTSKPFNPVPNGITRRQKKTPNPDEMTAQQDRMIAELKIRLANGSR